MSRLKKACDVITVMGIALLIVLVVMKVLHPLAPLVTAAFVACSVYLAIRRGPGWVALVALGVVVYVMGFFYAKDYNMPAVLSTVGTLGIVMVLSPAIWKLQDWVKAGAHKLGINMP